MSEWLAMGGYGAYVWGSYGAAAVAVVAELIALAARRRRALVQARLENQNAS
jgi:heme exporter protein D